MLVITGATGRVGSKITEALLARGEKVRVIGRSGERLKAFAEKGAETAVGDLGDRSFLTAAFSGAEAVFVLIPPNYGVPDFRAYQARIGESIAEALHESGVRYAVNLSSQGADLAGGTGPIAGLHDQEVRLNGLVRANIVHLRPTYFMENLLTNIDLIRTRNIMGSAVRGDVSFAMIATKDIASVAAERLLKRDFSGRIVQDLLGQRDISLSEAAAIIGKRIGKPDLKYVSFPYDDAEKAMIGMGLTPDLSRLYVEMSRALNDGRFAVGVLRTTANTTPTSFEEFAGEFAEAYHAAELRDRKAA